VEIEVKKDCSGVNWATVAETLKTVGMGYYDADLHQKAFEASYATVFVYHASQLIGFGRAISDGAYQAAVYDCAILPKFQGKGIGKIIMNNILSQVEHCNIILYASPGKEGFYETHGFRKMKTGMAHFIKSDSMRERGYTE